MANVEIDENELMNYRQIAGAMQKMLAHPQTRRKILEAQKTINPNAVIPEIDAAAPINAALQAVNEEVKSVRKLTEDMLASAEKDKTMRVLEAKWETGRSAARRAGYTAEGIEALEKFMEDNGVAEHVIAMPAFERLNPPASSVKPSGSHFEMLQNSLATGEDDTKLLLEGNDRQFLNKRISQALSDVRSGNR